ncbi:hypothetical protein JW824_07615 [bacterium]|nr:hypothetical protein [bacterium]
MMHCYRCGREVHVQDRVGRQETCPHCGVYLHCCLNCRFYDPNAYHQCRESEAEYVSDKESANFCDYFEPGDSKKSQRTDRAEEAKKKLEQLFQKKKSEDGD